MYAVYMCLHVYMCVGVFGSFSRILHLAIQCTRIHSIYIILCVQVLHIERTRATELLHSLNLITYLFMYEVCMYISEPCQHLMCTAFECTFYVV